MGDYTLVDLLISSVLALIMFGIGLSLSLQSFRQLIVAPRPLIVGLFSQMLVLPFIAFLFCYFSGLSAELKMGIMILSVCPGGTTSNFITYLLNGNTALSVSMTTVNSFLTLFSIPFIVNMSLLYFLGEGTVFHLPYLETISQIFSITIIPAALGILVRVKFSRLAKILNRPIRFSGALLDSINFTLLKTVTIILLGLVFGIKLLASENAGGAGLDQDDFEQLLPIGMLFNATGLLFGYLFSLLLNLKKEDPMTIAVEVGLQNTTLAFLVAGTLLHNIEMQKPALVYAFFSFWTAIIFGFIIKKFLQRNLS